MFRGKYSTRLDRWTSHGECPVFELRPDAWNEEVTTGCRVESGARCDDRLMPRLHQRNMLRGNKLLGRATCCLLRARNKLLVARNMLLQVTRCAATSCADEQFVAGNKQHVACNKQLVACCPQQVASSNMLHATSNLLRRCKRGFNDTTLMWSILSLATSRDDYVAAELHGHNPTAHDSVLQIAYNSHYTVQHAWELVDVACYAVYEI